MLAHTVYTGGVVLSMYLLFCSLSTPAVVMKSICYLF